MASSNRHRFIESPGSYSTPFRVHARPGDGSENLTARLSRFVADGDVYRPVRVALDSRGTEWSKPRPVADQRHRSPVGYRSKADLELDVQRKGRLQDLGRRT